MQVSIQALSVERQPTCKTHKLQDTAGNRHTVLSLPSRPQPAATCIMNNRLPACTPILFLARLLMFSLLLGLPFSSAKTITPLFDGITATGTVSDASPAFFVLNVSATLWQYDRWCVNSLFLALLPLERSQ